MNKLLISLLLFITGIGLIEASSTVSNNVLPTISAPQAQVDNNWPYCNEPPAPIPHINPCPPGSHVDQACADKCGLEYQAKVARIMQIACSDLWLLYINLLVAIDNAKATEDACNASGTSQSICYQQYRATLHQLDNQYGKDRDKLAKRVSDEVQKALDEYSSCLFSCPCLENGVVR